MSNIILLMAPGTCARVIAIALEELNLDFEARPVRFKIGEHKSPEFKQYNPKGKVPALVINGQPLTENVAILTYLNETYSGLMPIAESPIDKASQLADLCFCAATLHPLVTRIRMPQMFAGPDGAYTVRDIGSKAMDEYFKLINARLANQLWWYGDKWSVMDAYLFWCFWRVEGAGYDTNRYPNFKEHARRMEERPSTIRAMQREDAAEAILKSEGLSFVPPV